MQALTESEMREFAESTKSFLQRGDFHTIKKSMIDNLPLFTEILESIGLTFTVMDNEIYIIKYL